jgi:hypothetical protein
MMDALDAVRKSQAAAVTLASDVIRQLERLDAYTLPKLGLLLRMSEVQGANEYETDSPRLDQLAWRGIEDLCHDVLRDLETLIRTAGIQQDGFVTLSDEGVPQ